MKFSTEINKIRRYITRGLTKNIRCSDLPQLNEGEKLCLNRILIIRPNGRLGNLLMLTPLVQEIISTFPECKIDLFVKGYLAPIIFKNYENVDKIITLPKKPFNELIKYMSVWTTLRKQKYDMVINIDKGSSSGRIATKISSAKFKIFGDEIANLALKYKDYRHMAKAPVHNFREFLTFLGYNQNNNSVPSLDLKLEDSEIEKGKQILQDLVQNDAKMISIFTYATCSKCYSVPWWEEFYKELKANFPDYTIIEILPIENVSQINFQAKTFYSKDVREIAAVIACTSFFIGADSGVMHLASASKTPTFGLFSVTDPKMYAPYSTKSFAINTNYCDASECIDSIKNQLKL